MSRSLYKGNVIDKKNLFNNQKIWSRDKIILPSFLNKDFLVYNGRTFIELKITKPMVGYKFGNFVFTKTSNQFEKWNNN